MIRRPSKDIAIIEINTPEVLNALNKEVMEELSAAGRFMSIPKASFGLR